MTSMDFFNHPSKTNEEPPEWGTGKMKESKMENLWTAKAPTWHYSGQPVEQFYTLTKLKLSNVRLSDQLLPNPQHSEMHKLMINKPFPAEHPYASHEERKAVFPKFDSPEDHKRGVDARRQKPKNDEMPSMPYDVTIVSKTKGNPRRHEIQSLPPESLKAPLVWPEHTFDQLVKSPEGGQQVYYPIPPKTLVPNLEARSDSQCIKGNMVVNPGTANAMRNVERNQWRTTYDINHTGLGPSNPMVLDNHSSKQSARAVGVLDQSVDQLQPHSLRTFDPPRPKEGRIARAITPAAPPQTDRWPNPDPDPNYERLKTLTEKEEDRLLNGFPHRNYPENPEDEDAEWINQQTAAHADSGVNVLKVNQGGREEVPYKPFVGPPPPPEWGPIEQAALDQHEQFQQVEAQNRWKLLESQKSHHNLKARQHKLNMAVDKEQPKVFYDHEGQFQTERAGMYKTTYDPYSLQSSMNKLEDSGGYKFDISEMHKDALNLPVQLNNDMHDAMRYGRTLGGPPGSVPQLNSQPSPYEAIEPFNKLKQQQRSKLTPNMETADVKTLEGGVVLRESSMGEDYNTHKFLQDHDLPMHSRKEPLILMSHENQDLNKVRSSATPKRVNWSPQIQVAQGGGVEPLRMSMSGGETRTAADVLPALTPRGAISARDPPTPGTLRLKSSTGNNGGVELPVALEKDRKNGKVDSRYARFGVDDQFASKSTTFTGPTDFSWNMKSAYADLHPGAVSVDMSFKNDRRFNWKAGTGDPRPQTSLLQIQNAFTKSDARKKFHRQFYEINPDLRENIFRGKQHEFNGMNAQVLRGTPVDAF